MIDTFFYLKKNDFSIDKLNITIYFCAELKSRYYEKINYFFHVDYGIVHGIMFVIKENCN